MSWQTLGAVAPTDLLDARLQLHHAAQVVASAGLTFLDPQPDDSHPNMQWHEPLGALLGRSLPGAESQVGLCVADLALVLVDKDGRATESLALDGRTLGDAYDWLASVTTDVRTNLRGVELQRPGYDIPAHVVASGEPFSSASGGGFAELAHWFANGDRAQVELAGHTPEASDVRCWPHHFDLGFLAVLATKPDGSLAKSIGVGLSPGDESYGEPYWYVSPWPYAEGDASGELPALPCGGYWHREGFTSAVLTGSALLKGAQDSQAERLQAFLDTAVDASRRILAA